jgi:peptide/nickel transport system permease protein
MNHDLIKILIKRFISSVLILFFLISFLFILLRIAPGDPTQRYISPGLSPQLAEKVKVSFNLDRSVQEQYLSFVKNFFSGDLGVSYSFHTSVTNVLFEFLPFTISFSLIAFFFQFSLGLLLAVFAYKNRSKKYLDGFISGTNMFLYAVPSFVSGVFLIYLFSVKLELLPSSGIKNITSVTSDFGELLFDYLTHLILPVICLALAGTPVYFKYFRDNIEQNYNKLYVRYLRSNGVTENVILYKHVIPNAISPIISYAGVDLGMLFSSVLITEVIFSLPGMGRLAVGAILDRDFPLVVGCALSAGTLMIITNFIADIIKFKIDKRLINGVLN